jgi:phenylalanyl-tRNA synthetase beta subunit
MSADNSIVILRTRDGYRVNHVQALENIFWNDETNSYNTKKLNLDTTYEYFHRAYFFKTREDALKRAFEYLGEIGYVEDGIIEISFPKITFPKRSIRYELSEVINQAEEELQKNSGIVFMEDWKNSLLDKIIQVVNKKGNCNG